MDRKELAELIVKQPVIADFSPRFVRPIGKEILPPDVVNFCDTVGARIVRSNIGGVATVDIIFRTTEILTQHLSDWGRDRSPDQESIHYILQRGLLGIVFPASRIDRGRYFLDQGDRLAQIVDVKKHIEISSSKPKVAFLPAHNGTTDHVFWIINSTHPSF